MRLEKKIGAAKIAWSEALVPTSALFMALAAQWILSGAIRGTNYYGLDGKMVQSLILTSFKFSGYFDLTSINPLQGIGSQLLPKNVWANPSLWPFAWFDKEIATDVSALIAFAGFASAMYVMTRCFDVPPLPSAVAAQLSIALFAPALLLVHSPTNFCLTPGDAIVYAPYMVVFGLLARLEPASWRSFALTAAGISALVLYSIYCDPLWAMIAAISWAVPLAVVTLAPLRMKAVVLRAAALICCLALLVVSGAASYLQTLSQFTERVQYAEVLDRVRGPEFVSAMTYSSNMKYFYVVGMLGWLVGGVLLRGRARVLVFATSTAFIIWALYSIVYLLLLNVAWIPPIPIYLEQCLFPLYLSAAVAGYWSLLSTGARLFARGGAWFGTRIAAARQKMARASLPAQPAGAAGRQRRWKSGLAVALAIAAVAILPAWVVRYALVAGPAHAKIFYEAWANEPELIEFLENNTGLAVGGRFRGQVNFLNPIGFTLATLWSRRVPTTSEYSQLVTPYGLYFMQAVVERKVVGGDLNSFNLFSSSGTYSTLFWQALAMLGVRYAAAISPLGASSSPGFALTTKPFRPREVDGQPGTWYVYELPNPNLGNYSPTEVVVATSGAEILALWRKPEFDFTRQVVLSARVDQPLVPARDMQLSVIRGGLHVSGRSDAASLVILPQQFSHCLRASSGNVRFMRANLMATAMIFSGEVDTDIHFDYGIFSSSCRRADLAEFKRLDLRIDQRMPHLSGHRLFPDWHGAIAQLRTAVERIQ